MTLQSYNLGQNLKRENNLSPLAHLKSILNSQAKQNATFPIMMMIIIIIIIIIIIVIIIIIIIINNNNNNNNSLLLRNFQSLQWFSERSY